jgi:hypothetical protein
LDLKIIWSSDYQNIGWRFNWSVVLLVCFVPYGNEDLRPQFFNIQKKFWYKIRLIYLYQKFIYMERHFNIYNVQIQRDL